MQVYLDNAATTKMDPAVFEAMRPWFVEDFGNASAKHYAMGVKARNAVLRARQKVATLIGAEVPPDEDRAGEIIFTSGATESNNWVLRAIGCNCGGHGHGGEGGAADAKPKHVLVSAIEHHSVLETAETLAKRGAFELTVLPVDELGRIRLEELRAAMRPDTALVSIMHANNEVGTLQPIAEAAAIAHEHGALFHTDAVQTVGKIPVDVNALGVDLLSLSGHKFHGPKGVGALYVRKGTRLPAMMLGGGQESKRRAGTLNVPGIVGLGAAAAAAPGRMETANARMRELTEHLYTRLAAEVPKLSRNGDPETRLPNVLNVRFEGVEGEALLMYLDMMGVQVATASACSTDSLEPSHVLMAMGVPAEHAHGALRFSLSHETTRAEIDAVAETLPKQVDTLRQMSVTWKG